MTLRDAIRAALAGGDASELADVPVDEVGQALASYADTSSLAEADALAPIVTRASPVPFEVEIDGELGAPIVDIHAELGSIDASSEMSALASADDDVDPGESIDGRPTDAAGIDADDRDPGDLFDGRADTNAETAHQVEADAHGGDDFGAGRELDEGASEPLTSVAEIPATDAAAGFDEVQVEAINDMFAEDIDPGIVTSIGLDDDVDALDDDGDIDVDA